MASKGGLEAGVVTAPRASGGAKGGTVVAPKVDGCVEAARAGGGDDMTGMVLASEGVSWERDERGAGGAGGA